jgi:hypothetical protein
MKHQTLSFGRFTFTRLKDGAILMACGTESAILPRKLPFHFADLQRLYRLPGHRERLTRALSECLESSKKNRM